MLCILEKTWNVDYFDSGMDDIFIILIFKLLHLQQTNKEYNLCKKNPIYII